METSKTAAKQNWHQVKAEVLKNWNKLTPEEIEKTPGDMKAIGALIQSKYGETQKNYVDRLSVIFKDYDGFKGSAVDAASKTAKKPV